MSNVIELKHVSKNFRVLNRREGFVGSIKDLFSRNYSVVHAVDDISMDISCGEIIGYLGPNGAGKSTTIKMMTGILQPTFGTILINGCSPYKNRERIAQDIGVVFGQRSQLWWSLPLVESFRLLKDIYTIDDIAYKDMLDIYGSLMDIDSLLHKTVRQMSLGQRTLSDILAAFLHNPSVVFLDEPTIGLDVSMKSRIRSLILALNKEKHTTVVLTTHDMGDVDALCRRVVIIDKGKAIYDNDMEHLKRYFGTYRTLSVSLDEFCEAQNKKVSKLQREKAEEQIKNMIENFAVYPVMVTFIDGWLSITIDDEKNSVMDILSLIQSRYTIKDIKLEDGVRFL